MTWPRRRAEPSAEELMAIAREHAQAERYEEALAIWEPLARAGHARACNNIGACFAEGMGVERDPLMAERWLAPAAEAGDPVAQHDALGRGEHPLPGSVDGDSAWHGPDPTRSAALAVGIVSRSYSL